METVDLIDFILDIIKVIGIFIFFIAMYFACKDIDDMEKRIHNHLEEDLKDGKNN